MDACQRWQRENGPRDGLRPVVSKNMRRKPPRSAGFWSGAEYALGDARPVAAAREPVGEASPTRPTPPLFACRPPCGVMGGSVTWGLGVGISLARSWFRARDSTPSYLPHQGGGFAPLLWHHLAPPTGRHLPLDGGGWEGVGPLASRHENAAPANWITRPAAPMDSGFAGMTRWVAQKQPNAHASVREPAIPLDALSLHRPARGRGAKGESPQMRGRKGQKLASPALFWPTLGSLAPNRMSAHRYSDATCRTAWVFGTG
jgi:hypothetical protein